MRMRSNVVTIVFTLIALSSAFGALSSASAATPGFGSLYLNDEVVRTVVPPAAAPNDGRDNLYVVPDQLAVVAVGPGSAGYHGGQWAFHSVSWNVDPYLLTSADAVLTAEAVGDVTIIRVPENDFKCPVQP